MGSRFYLENFWIACTGMDHEVQAAYEYSGTGFSDLLAIAAEGLVKEFLPDKFSIDDINWLILYT